MANFPSCPTTLKPIMHFLKVAQEHEERNMTVCYWGRLHSLQVGLTLCSGHKSPEETALLVALMDWLEVTKKANADNESITNEICAQSSIEEYALKLFKYADEQDRAENYNKNVVKAFYTCGVIMDILAVFGELSEDILEKQKYAKWKAAYIHNCLKMGEKPIPGPMVDENSESNDANQESNTNEESENPSIPTMGFVSQPGLPSPNNPYQFPPSNFGPGSTTPTGYEPQPFIPPSIPLEPTPAIPPIQPVSVITPIPKVPVSGDIPELTADQIAKAQKYCKWASSALNYDDIKTAIENLQKGLQLLQTGNDPV